MGAPKQKWTAEEEAALRAGIIKHGAGKWQTILRDPEFSSILYLRSNVDLKDKWRNMNVMVSGLGSREKCRLPVRRTNVPEQEESSESPTNVVQSDEETLDVQPSEVPVQKRPIVRLENLIVEAITNLKEPGGSNKSSIAEYIEDEYWAPPDLKSLLSTKLKFMTAVGKLVKRKRKYRIVPASPAYDNRRRNNSILLCDGRKNVTTRIERENFSILTRDQIDLDLARMATMSPEEAAAVAAQAVSEAEAAIAEAEEAEREAVAAEAAAEAARAYIDVSRGRNSANG